MRSFVKSSDRKSKVQCLNLRSEVADVQMWVRGRKYATVGQKSKVYGGCAAVGQRSQVCDCGSEVGGVRRWVRGRRYATVGQKSGSKFEVRVRG